MGLANNVVVVGGRVAKCIEVKKGFATVAWIDHRDRIVTREVPAAACLPFAEATRPRSFWPEANVPFDETEERRARRNRKRTAN